MFLLSSSILCRKPSTNRRNGRSGGYLSLEEHLPFCRQAHSSHVLHVVRTQRRIQILMSGITAALSCFLLCHLCDCHHIDAPLGDQEDDARLSASAHLVSFRGKNREAGPRQHHQEGARSSHRVWSSCPSDRYGADFAASVVEAARYDVKTVFGAGPRCHRGTLLSTAPRSMKSFVYLPCATNEERGTDCYCFSL